MGLVRSSAAGEESRDGARTTAVLRAGSPAAAGLAWVTLVAGLDWGQPEFVLSTALTFGALALIVGALARWNRLRRTTTVRWGSLAAAGVALAALLSVEGANSVVL